MASPYVTYNFPAAGYSQSDRVEQNFADLLYYISVRNSGLVAWDAVYTNYLDLVPTATASAPAAVAGRIYFNSDDLQFYGCKDGLTWSIIG